MLREPSKWTCSHSKSGKSSSRPDYKQPAPFLQTRAMLLYSSATPDTLSSSKRSLRRQSRPPLRSRSFPPPHLRRNTRTPQSLAAPGIRLLALIGSPSVARVQVRTNFVGFANTSHDRKAGWRCTREKRAKDRRRLGPRFCVQLSTYIKVLWQSMALICS